MLRITVTSLPGRARVMLEGRLAGAWVSELGACWESLLATHAPSRIEVDLDGLTFVTPAGKELIRSMHARGAMLAATEMMIRTILDEEI
jgi:hypothetical protein